MTAYIHIPAEYALQSASAVGGRVEDTSETEGVVSVVLRRQTSGEAKLLLTFAQPTKKAPL